jgi:hypothetical protein
MALCPHTICECAKTHTTRRAHGILYEIQDDLFRCGPVAILNALRAAGRYSGRAQRRQVALLCNARLKHADGFCGTRPPEMDAAITHFWPDSKHFVGAEACKAAMLGAERNTFGIFLFRRPDGRGGAHYYHYVYAHNDRGYWEFENSFESSQTWWKTVKDCKYPATQFMLPQLWILRKA